MVTPEGVPATLPNKQFPLGDIDDPYKEERAAKWLTDIDKKHNFGYRASISIYSELPSLASENARNTHLAAKALCATWDTYAPEGMPLSRVGYRLVMAFNRETGYLPQCEEDFTDIIESMEVSQADMAREFGRAAWAGLDLYPDLQATYAKLLAVGRKRYELDDDENKEFFIAGMSLPYMFAWASRLQGYSPDFRAMPAGSIDLEKSDFKKLFLTDVKLAENPTYPTIT